MSDLLDQSRQDSRGDRDRLDSLHRELRERLGARYEGALASLPLALRFTVESSVQHPYQTWCTPPKNELGAIDKKGSFGSFLALDTTGSTPLLSLVLFDWDELTLDVAACEDIGLPIDDLILRLQRYAVPSVNRDKGKRWSVQERVVEERRKVTLSSRGFGGAAGKVSPRVGRIALGRLGWPSVSKMGEVEVEVLALPRLTSGAPRAGSHTWLVDPEAERRWLDQTVFRWGAPATLIALLRLAHGIPWARGLDRVRMSATEDPSPLAWLAVVDALELAAEEQRRQYTRRDEVARAPVGTIRFNSYFGSLAHGRPDRVPVTRFDLSRDTLENRLFKGSADVLRRKVRASDELGRWLRGRVEKILASYPQTSTVEPELWMARGLVDKELPPPLEEARARCEDLLAFRHPGLRLEGDSFARMSGFELDIAELFEAACRTVVRQATAAEFSVLDGNDDLQRHELRWEHRLKEGAFGASSQPKLKPDILVRRGSRLSLIGDAKYKRPRFRGDTSFAPLGREDFQQMMTYLSAWPKVGGCFVIFPWSEPRVDGDLTFATRLVSTMALPGKRELAIFQLAPERWRRARVEHEPLTLWLREHDGVRP